MQVNYVKPCLGNLQYFKDDQIKKCFLELRNKTNSKFSKMSQEITFQEHEEIKPDLIITES